MPAKPSLLQANKTKSKTNNGDYEISTCLPSHNRDVEYLKSLLEVFFFSPFLFLCFLVAIEALHWCLNVVGQSLFMILTKSLLNLEQNGFSSYLQVADMIICHTSLTKSQLILFIFHCFLSHSSSKFGYSSFLFFSFLPFLIWIEGVISLMSFVM